MGRPLLLDLFSGAGGAAAGYDLAGFDVVGVDSSPQPRYPFLFVQSDAFDFLARNGRHFAAIHASPPCQAYSEATPVPVRGRLPRLIEPIREALQATGKPFVIENVENARQHLRTPVMLCGSMFGLRVWRHRYFETHGFWLLSPGGCQHRGRPVTLHCGSNTRKTRRSTGVDAARAAMGIDWMTLHELYEAIPPAYTNFVGRQLRAAIERERAA